MSEAQGLSEERRSGEDVSVSKEPQEGAGALLIPQIRTIRGGLGAEIRFVPSSDSELWPGPDEVVRALGDEGITCGLDREAIMRVLEGKVAGSWVPVAEGVPPRHGEDARLEVDVDMGEAGPREVQDSGGQVDMKDLGLIRNVEEGAVIARKHPSTPGIDGTDVTGKPITARAGRDLKLLGGKNTHLSEDGLVLTSKVNGHLKQEGNRYEVNPLFEVHSDVDYSTGNLEFYGQLKVYGAVKEDFRLEARGGIEVLGVIEGAQLLSGGDILLKSSVMGMGKGILEASGSITACYLDQCEIRAGRDLVFQKGLMHCQSLVGRSIRATETGKGLVLGGRVEAGVEVECLNLGNDMGTRTEVAVGVPPDLLQKRKKLEAALAELETKQDMVAKNLHYLSRVVRSEGVTAHRKVQVEKYMKLRRAIEEQLERGQKGLEALEKAIDSMKEKCSVRVHGICYPGVTITIRGNTFVVREAMSEVSFVYQKGAVVAAPLE